MKKGSSVQFILTIFAAVMSVAGVVLGIINLARNDGYRIRGAYSIGLGYFFSDEMTKMHIMAACNPNWTGDFYDESVLIEFKEILSSATFQKGEKYEPSPDSVGDDGNSISFTSERTKYYFSLQGGTFEVTIGDETGYYYTNAYHDMSELIYQTAVNLYESDSFIS